MNDSGGNALSLSGIWQAVTPDGSVHSMRLPGTLDENNIGGTDPEDGPEIGSGGEEAEQTNRYSRKYAYEGAVRLSRMLSFEEEPHKRYFLEAERSRVLTLFIDGEEVEPVRPITLVSPAVFEVTGRLQGDHMLTLEVDNLYENWPAEELKASNMASEDTATNWSGVLGYVRIREEEAVYPESVQMSYADGTARISVTLDASYRFQGTLTAKSPAFAGPVSVPAEGPSGFNEFTLLAALRDDVPLFEENKGVTVPLTVSFSENISADESRFTAETGFRTFAAVKSGFTLNGRPVYLRGETSEGLHPETAYPPMKKDIWAAIFHQYAAYGLNFVRFKGHCPPDAAFAAADESGMLLMPELSHDPGRKEVLTEEAKAYYREELSAILRTFGLHPSFAAFGLPFGEKNADFAEELINEIKVKRPDLPVAVSTDETLDTADFDLKAFVPALAEPGKPMVLSGGGTVAMLPDFREIDLFSGVLEPTKLVAFSERVREAGLSGQWEKYVEASGETALIRYREIIERVLREPAVSGIFLESLQDVPGKRQEPRGMLTSHLVSKQYPFSAPEKFRSFFDGVSLSARFPRYAYSESETFKAAVTAVAFAPASVEGVPTYVLTDGERTESGSLPEVKVDPGERKKLGLVECDLSAFRSSGRKETELTFRLRFAGKETVYPLFVYPETVPICPENVYETAVFDLRAMDTLKKGGLVFYTPSMPDTALPVSAVMDTAHPLFRHFKTAGHTDERWFRMIDKPGFVLPKRIKPIVGTLPIYAARPMTASLFEARVLNGAILVSSLGLKEKIAYPEVAALLSGIYEYMASYDFSPSRELTLRELQDVIDAPV